MNQTVPLALANIASAQLECNLLRETVSRAILCTPSGPTRNELTEVNIMLNNVKTRLAVAFENLENASRL